MLEHAAHDGTLKATFNGLKTDTGFAFARLQGDRTSMVVRFRGKVCRRDTTPTAPRFERLRECVVGRGDRVLVAIDYAGVELALQPTCPVSLSGWQNTFVVPIVVKP